MQNDPEINTFYLSPRIGQLVSALIWGAAGYVVSRLVIKFPFTTSLVAFVLAAGIIVIIDSFIINLNASPTTDRNTRIISTYLRVIISLVVASLLSTAFIWYFVRKEVITEVKIEKQKINELLQAHEAATLEVNKRKQDEKLGHTQKSSEVAEVERRIFNIDYQLQERRRRLEIMRTTSAVDALEEKIANSISLKAIWISLIILIAIQDSIVLVLSSLARKRKVIDDQKQTILVQEKHLEDSINQQINLIASVQHELGNKLPSAKNSFSSLTIALNKLEGEEQPFSVNRKIREALPGEAEEEIDTIDDIINRINTQFDYCISIVDNIGGIVSADRSRFKPESRYLLSYIKEYISSSSRLNSHFETELLGEDLQDDFDPKQMGILLSNLIENAVKHSFIQKNKAYLLSFELRRDGDNAVLNVRNNGSPFTDGFTIADYKRPHKYAGATGNSGIGGYLVGLVVDNHNGSMEILKPGASEKFNVEIRIILPKKQNV